MKSVNTNNSVSSLISRMSANDMNAVLLGAKSDIPILNLNAVIFGAKSRCTSPEFIELLKTKMLDSGVSFMGMPLKVLRRQHSMFSEFKSTMEPTILFVS